MSLLERLQSEIKIAMKNKILQILNDGDYSKYNWLDADNPNCNSDEYFKQISYYIDLSDLYNVIDTCYYSDDMQFCPIFIELKEEKIIAKHDNSKYLIQVWNLKHERICELPMKLPLRKWAICFRYLIYTLQDDEFIYIIDLEEENKSVQISSFGLDPSVNYYSFNNGYLFAVSDYKIQILNVTAQQFSKEGTLIDASNSKIRTINTPLKIHGMPMSSYQYKDKYSMVVFETPDNQLEFDKILFDNFQDDAKFSYKYEQIREAVPREVKRNDPITKNCFVFSNGFMFGMSLRQSGGFDIYWNMQRKESVDDEIVKDIAMSIGSYYFLMEDGTVKGFAHQNNSVVSFMKSKVISASDINFDKIYMKRLQNIAKLYSGFHIVMIRGVTQAVITHGNFVSLYDINNKKWINHLSFEDEIILLFRHYKSAKDRYQTILCKNGAVYISILDYDDYKQPVPVSKRNLNIESKILRWGEDIENNQTLFLVCKEKEATILQAIFRAKLQKVDIVKDAKENLNVVCFQSRGEKSHVLLQNGTDYTLYLQNTDKDVLNLQKIKAFSKFDGIKGILHSACAFDIKNNFFLFDETNMYLVKIPQFDPPTLTVYENINCVGIQTIQKNFNYALCQQTAKSQNPGLRFFDMEQIVKRDKPQMTLLKNISVGVLGYFEKGVTVMRFGFMQSLDYLIVTPILHRNMNRLMGAGNLDDYLCFNVVKDKVIALRKTGLLQTWNLYTGKLEKEVKLTNIEWDKYEIHSKTKRGRILLRSKEDIKGEKNEDHFFQWQLTPNIENCRTFQLATAFKFKRWIYIEITSPEEIKIHLEFVHPNYQFQRMFINDKIDRLVAILINYRVYFYQPEIIDEANPSKIRWKLIRQMTDYPNDLDNDSKYLEHFSPCLQRYLSYDKKDGQMIIKGTYSGQELFRVPKNIMNISKNDPNPKYFTNRISWVSTNKLQVVDKDGIENLYDIDEDFKELAYNVRPLFNNIDGVEWQKWHYYKERATFSQDEILKRLKVIYQNYKTAYYLNERKNIFYLKNVMFNVDNWYFHHNEQSFSYVHWSLMEQMKAGVLNIADLEPDVIEQLIYNIVPGGNTILHYLADQKDQLQKLFELTHNDEGIKVHIPFLSNYSGISLLHMLAAKKDFKSINTVLSSLQLYDIDHHSRAIKNVYPLLVQQQLPALLDYLDSRLKQTDQLKAIDKGSLKEDVNDIIVSRLQFERGEIDRQIFDEEEACVVNVKMEFLDIPGFYHYNDAEFDTFFQQLAQTDRFEYFSNKAIQKIIDFNYPLVQKYITYYIVIPFILFHITFVFYMNVIFENIYVNDYYYYLNWILAGVLLIFATYFLQNEYQQLKVQKMEYITSVWNYIDLIAPLGIFALMGIRLFVFFEIPANEDVVRCILSISTFFMWLKLLYIMRIFKKTGYLIRMIVDVVADMGVFLLLLLITILAFGDSLLRISLGNESVDDQFTGGNFFMAILYAYRMILGDFATDSFGDVAVPMVWIFFLFATIFDLIVMLNLLIAIISDSYARIANVSEQAGYSEMAKLIDENKYLIPLDVRQNYANQDQYLVILTNLEKDQTVQGDPVMDKLKNLQAQIDEMNDVLREFAAGKRSIEETAKDVQEVKNIQVKQYEDQNKIHEEITKLLTGQAKISKDLAIQPDGTTILSKIHCHELTKYTLGSLKQATKTYNNGFACDGRKFTGCQSGMTGDSTEYKTDLDEKVMHCYKCNFDYCSKCIEAYGEKAHSHPLSSVTFAQLQKIGAYSNGWLCDARFFKGCPNGTITHKDEKEVLYHESGCNFDLCQDCAINYRA